MYELENAQAARRRKIVNVIMWVVLLVLFIAFIFPFIMALINAFKANTDINRFPLALIGPRKGFITSNFPTAMEKMNFWGVFGNSVIITVSATVLTLLFSGMCAFVVTRNNWVACRLIFALMIASMVIPFQVLMIPIVSIYGGTLNVLNHRLTLILMHTGFSVSMATFMYSGAIKTNIPLELEEAALIDGCTRWQTYWKVVYPLLGPTTATVAIIDAMAFWNDYLLPSLVLTNKPLYTIPIATQIFYGSMGGSDMGCVLAALILAMLPILILYLVMQKYIVEGVTSGAVKG
jgi:raffinose/stachyose/melibiose transport system permease protein